MSDQFQWSDQQRRAIEDINSGRNVLITGFAGTGKSTLLRYIRKQVKGLQVTATTGVAAVNVKGSTVHSWAKLGIGNQPPSVVVRRILKDKKACQRMKRAKALAIDEISMFPGEMVDYLDTVLRRVRNRDEPFGGIQMVLFGDFLQLPPVKGAWCFDAKSWKEADIAVSMLSKSYRQEDQGFIDLLAQVRSGEITDSLSVFLNSRKSRGGLTGQPVAVYTHNVDVDSRNAREFEKLSSPIKTYRAVLSGSEYHQEALCKNVLAPKWLHLRKKARVMLLQNLDVKKGLCNGSTGTVESLGSNCVNVAFDNGKKVDVAEYKWEHYEGSEPVASFTQIPLRLAYAATAHKCQGMQFDNMEVDLSRCFAAGQAYVALSRAKRPEGLVVTDWNEDAVFADDKALAFYEAFNQAAN